MLSQFFILSSRGDSIISKDFRGDGVATLQEVFFRNVKVSACPRAWCCAHARTIRGRR